jgi:hypothetical protein
MEKSTGLQFPAYPTNVNELQMKLQEIQNTTTSKEDLVILYANLNEAVNARKLSLQQEMDHLNDVHECINHMQGRLTLASEEDACFVPESHESWNFDSTGVPFNCVQCTDQRQEWYKKCNQKNELTCGACKQCAFCTPKWRECWMGNHLPKSRWNGELTKVVTSMNMEESFKNKGVTARTGLKKRKAIYLQERFQNAPITTQHTDFSSSQPERKCVTHTATP